MPKPNYALAKRHRDLAKKLKKEEKRLRKIAAHQDQAAPENAEPPTDAPAADNTTAEKPPGGPDS